MVTLYTYGPMYNLKDMSPFVIKTHVLLRMAKIDYRVSTQGYRAAPKGKLPFINDNGKIVADSTFIRFHIEDSRKIGLDAHLTDSQKAVAWAFEKMCEDHLYWALLESRWLNPKNFKKGPAHFFKEVPAVIRPVIKKLAVKMVRKSTVAHGMGRHSKTEIEQLAMRDLKVVSDFLADKPFFMGNEPSAVDATIYAFVSSTLCQEFESPICVYAATLLNLVAYQQRMEDRFFSADTKH